MRFALASFVALASAALAAAKGINPDFAPQLVNWTAVDAAASAPEPATNAKRFEHHLPPLKPKTHRRARAPHRLGSRVQAAPRAEVSPLPPVNTKCNVLARDNTGSVGYISRTMNEYGEYGLSQNQPDALEVLFSYQPGYSSQMDMMATNGQTQAFKYIGGVVGYGSDSSDMGPGNSNYAYLAGTQQSAPGSGPQQGPNTFSTASGFSADYESAIWSFDPVTNAIGAQWVNGDGGLPPVSVLYANDGSNALIITSDPETLNRYFGTEYPQVTFTCTPPPASS